MRREKDIQESSTRRPPTKKQVVAGFIIYRRTNEGIKFLLLYRRGNYWNFPKGHFKQGENTIGAALRELWEETGLKKSELHIVPKFKAYQKFYFKAGDQGIYDIVVLFLAETRKIDIRIDPREHSGFAWFTYNDALRTIGKKYESVKGALKQAYNFLRAK